MSTKVFINLPVNNLSKSQQFFEGLGYSINKQFSNHAAICIVVSPQIIIMLLTQETFASFTPLAIANAKQSTQVINGISVASKEAVNQQIDKALAMGGNEIRQAQDLGFMYKRSFCDLDGHIWEYMYMDESAIPPAIPAEPITITAIVHKPIDAVWNSWVTPRHIMQWNQASPDWHTPKAENNLVVGGSFTYTMAAKDGSFSFDFEGIYTEVVLHQKIAYKLADNRIVSIKFEVLSQGVLVTETFDPEQENPIELQQAGWQNILNHFKLYTETNF